MWAMLGDIRFELLRAPETADLSTKYNYAEHPVIEGKPKLQWSGDALKERNWTLRLHSAFCDPDAVMTAMRAMADKHQALPLSLGSGQYLGRYVVTEIHEQMLITDAAGATVAQTADLRLKEWIGATTTEIGEAVAVTGAPVAGTVTATTEATATLEAVATVPDVFAAAATGLGVAVSTAVSALGCVAEMGPLSLPGLVEALPLVAQVGQALGATGLPGLSGLAASIQVAAGMGLAAIDAGLGVRDWLQDMADPDVLYALAARGVDLPAMLAAGSDPPEACTLAVRQALAGDVSRAAHLFGDADTTVVQAMAGNLPVYRAIRDASLSAVTDAPITGLRRIVRMGA